MSSTFQTISTHLSTSRISLTCLNTPADHLECQRNLVASTVTPFEAIGSSAQSTFFTSRTTQPPLQAFVRSEQQSWQPDTDSSGYAINSNAGRFHQRCQLLRNEGSHRNAAPIRGPSASALPHTRQRVNFTGLVATANYVPICQANGEENEFS